MYSKVIEVRYFPGTNEAAVIIDGVANRVFKSIKEALTAASAEFGREVIRYERTHTHNNSSR